VAAGVAVEVIVADGGLDVAVAVAVEVPVGVKVAVGGRRVVVGEAVTVAVALAGGGRVEATAFCPGGVPPMLQLSEGVVTSKYLYAFTLSSNRLGALSAL
jgi:hypothetical protein